MAYVPIDLPCLRCNWYRTFDFHTVLCLPCKREAHKQHGRVGPIFGRWS